MNISLKTLGKWGACNPAVMAFKDIYGDAEVPWQEVVAHPLCSSSWSEWVRIAVAMSSMATEDDYVMLTYDLSCDVRCRVAQYGNAENRKALRNDESWLVRRTVARYGSDEDRLILLHDEDICVRGVIALWGNDVAREILKEDASGYVRVLAAMNRPRSETEEV